MVRTKATMRYQDRDAACPGGALEYEVWFRRLSAAEESVLDVLRE